VPMIRALTGVASNSVIVTKETCFISIVEFPYFRAAMKVVRVEGGSVIVCTPRAKERWSQNGFVY
jgi:hypothetical protein